MSNWNPAPRPGYTRSGKSLKAVRRYYALKEASKRKRSPDNNEEEDKSRREDKGSTSKRKRSPNDDKLSKRIAAELKVQQEANEKRTRQAPPSFNLFPTERSALPVSVTPRETGPTFVAEPQEVAKTPKSVKSAKSLKSNKSVETAAHEDANPNALSCGSGTGLTSVGCTLTCLILAIAYIITWLFMLIVEASRARGLNQQEAQHSSMGPIRWLAIHSVLVVVTVPYWIVGRRRFRHAVITLALMTIGTIDLAVYVVYSTFIEEKPATKHQEHLFTRNPLNFWVSMTYLIFHLISMGLMVKQTLISSSKQSNARMSDTQMSQYLAPR